MIGKQSAHESGEEQDTRKIGRMKHKVTNGRSKNNVEISFFWWPKPDFLGIF